MSSHIDLCISHTIKAFDTNHDPVTECGKCIDLDVLIPCSLIEKDSYLYRSIITLVKTPPMCFLSSVEKPDFGIYGERCASPDLFQLPEDHLCVF